MQKRWSGAVELPWLSGDRYKLHASLLRRWHAGMVLDGDWDQATERFDSYHLSQVLSERFERGKDWREIYYIKKALRKVSRGEPAWGNRCRTEEEVLARCRYLDDLYERLKTEGYRADRRVGRFTHLIVNIGRDGRIIRNNDGKHRIILSKILGISPITARVFVRHREWQAVRDAVRSGTDPSLLKRCADHPDLQDILPAPWQQPGSP
jgi:hypothetical protein